MEPVKGERSIEVLGESKGGGIINIAEVDGFKADFSASLHTVIIFADDTKGSIAFIANVLAHDDCNIATMSVSRKGKHDQACLVIEMDSGIKTVTFDYLRSLSWVREVIYIPNIENQLSDNEKKITSCYFCVYFIQPKRTGTG